MSKTSCFSFLLGGKIKRSKVLRSKVAYAKKVNGNDCPKVKPMEFMDYMADTVDVSQQGDANVVAVHRDAESARQVRGVDEDKASAWTKIDSSDAGCLVAGEDGDKSKHAVSAGPDAVSVSPSAGRMMSPTASPELKRSCSNIETARPVPAAEKFDLPAKARSYGDLIEALPPGRLTTSGGAPNASSTASVRTSCSADRVMLKKRSSRQVLPSRSRKLWWRLLLWSHRNLHRPGASSAAPALPSADTYGASHSRQNGGYTSDTMDAATVAAAATTTTRELKNKEIAVEEDPIRDQWAAFSPETASSLDRVSTWVNSFGCVAFHVVDEEEEHVPETTEHDHSAGVHPFCSEIVECSTAAEKQKQALRRTAEEAAQPRSFSQTLKASSSVAHISGMGLQTVPTIAAFSSLRAVNLSGNVIVHIYPGSLPKGLRSLDLSRNKIGSIEGLRELTRLRVLNLSYNRISRIGHGLSKCTSIRELYLAGNKISDVEGLHRLLKLAVLDVSFNRITTAKSLGQLVASYGSLRALNLTGNPVQANVGDDTLRKAVSDLLPRLEYLNKQAVKPQRAREVAKDSVAQAALGNGGARRRTPPRRVSLGPASPARSGGRRSKSKTWGAAGLLEPVEEVRGGRVVSTREAGKGAAVSH